MAHALFISHASADDALVRRLCRGLEELLHESVWIDSRQLRGNELLPPALQQAIADAGGFVVLVSPAALQSRWVGKELRQALAIQQARGRDQYPVLPLALDGTRLGVLETLFDDEPLYVRITSAPGGIDEALHAILVALGRRPPADPEPQPQPAPEPVDELVLELTDLHLTEPTPGVHRPAARARLTHEPPAGSGRRQVKSAGTWTFVAPLGPIEADEIRWYLERYPTWPGTEFAPRAAAVEKALADWGQALYQDALPAAATEAVLKSWRQVGDQAARRLSILCDPAVDQGAPDAEARAAATALLALPWELLHDGRGFLFQGPRPVRVRRRLPCSEPLDLPLVAPPVRVLLASPRPEDQACGYIDHRAGALPMVAACEGLGGLVELDLLAPPTFDALRDALQRARDTRRPYHVLHFDGHGVYDPTTGLGGLCFEDPADQHKPAHRRHQTIASDQLGRLLTDYPVPLVFLEACQSAKAEQATESVASTLLKAGVASVIAMSHSVLVETARRFVAAFYPALADGARIGAAMLAGQRALGDDDRRGRVFGAGDLRLKDWFVPVLFQERDAPALFTRTLTPRARQDLTERLRTRLGHLPDPPATGFIGRSRDLLALERLLAPALGGRDLNQRWALIRGQGGEGKTALAAELARWLVRSGQLDRAAFCSVEAHGQVPAVLDALGKQLVARNYSVATFPDLDAARQPIERALTERPTLLVLDNLESLLPPPYPSARPDRDTDPDPDPTRDPTLAAEAAATLASVLALCHRLLCIGETRLVFTSREALPAPFDDDQRRIELARLAQDDAVALLEKVLDLAGDAAAAQAARADIEALVETVHGHARTLALLAPHIKAQGPARTRADLDRLLKDLDRQHPGSRERSLFASLALSVERLAPENQQRVRALGVFHGGVHPAVLAVMMGWEQADCQDLAEDLIRTGTATPDDYGHLTLNPALCPWLRGRLEPAERDDLLARWGAAMGQYVEFLYQQSQRDAWMAATLTLLGLANLFAHLDQVQRAGDPAATIELTTSLYSLLQFLDRPQLLARVAEVRDAAAAALAQTPAGGCGRAAFAAEGTRIEQALAQGQFPAALAGSEALLARARGVMADSGTWAAYKGADYDLAMACRLRARVLLDTGDPGAALPVLEEAQTRFEAIAGDRGIDAALGMAAVCISERGECLFLLGRPDEAAAAYQAAIVVAEQRGDQRSVAVGQGNLGNVWLDQGRLREALDAYQASRGRFAVLGEAGSVAISWHQTGMAWHRAGHGDAAEDAYQQALALKVQLGDLAGQARTLNALGNLYGDLLNRPEDAVTLYRQAADLSVRLADLAEEGRARSNLANTLRRLGRLAEARQAVRRAIECRAPFGHAAEPWKTWDILTDIETADGDAAAADAARARAMDAFLAYRRAGGENHTTAGRLARAVTELLQRGDAPGAQAHLQARATDTDLPDQLRPFVAALHAIATGSRDPALAADPALSYDMAAEILLLLDALGPP